MKGITITRTTRETDINLTFSLVREGEDSISTGIGFFDHMLGAFAMHGGFSLSATVNGDLHVDGHHTVEDTGIVLGKAFAQALFERGSVERFASFFVPMDEALAFAAVDISGRPYLVLDEGAKPLEGMIGAYDAALTREFFQAFCTHAGLTLHLKVMHGQNLHHITEALFKAAAHALRLASVHKDDLLSTKGMLESKA